MAVVLRADVQDDSDTVAEETAAGANTAARVGGLLRDLSDSLAFRIPSILTPAQITANQNDYNPAGLSGADLLRLDSDALRTLTGIVPGYDGQVLTVINVGTSYLFLPRENAGSAADNRFLFTTALGPKASCTIYYDGTLNRWLPIKLPATHKLHWGSGTAGNSAGGNRYLHAWNSSSAAATAGNDAPILMDRGGVAIRMQSKYINAALASANTTHTFQVNFVDSSLLTTIAATVTTSAVVETAVAYAAGDHLTIESVTSAADSTASCPRSSVVVVPDP